eukprot:734240-Amphidinium_carterae.1
MTLHEGMPMQHASHDACAQVILHADHLSPGHVFDPANGRLCRSIRLVVPHWVFSQDELEVHRLHPDRILETDHSRLAIALKYHLSVAQRPKPLHKLRRSEIRNRSRALPVALRLGRGPAAGTAVPPPERERKFGIKCSTPRVPSICARLPPGQMECN